ncbi:MAG: hypothetical protein ABIQ04_02395 [Candidatus Saccharimonadales bacterium]
MNLHVNFILLVAALAILGFAIILFRMKTNVGVKVMDDRLKVLRYSQRAVATCLVCLALALALFGCGGGPDNVLTVIGIFLVVGAAPPAVSGVAALILFTNLRKDENSDQSTGL